ncbi:class I fructose-bisphosphate aldolase [Oceanobacillus alkalisoli]|uniref:class I fructose-bisphosphate aldolase n=1 Tax=Oceanobacillus alkalisoli TaxID=2925113 RepID=UPI001EEF867F|nr:hypothetical protein [Oceanobacillus alkalisoli]MCF3944111.1 hypothetical protein [Oceanobacillus alkalisoli]MCG5102519.1 hypothetical protein [Oceanobacillus alkalisoli]
MGKSLRLSRIFRKDTGNTLVLPVDHGIGGSMEGLEDPVKTLRELQTPGVDAVLLNDGVARQASEVFQGKGAPGRMLNADVFSYEVKNERMEHQLTFSPETAVRRGYDCMKLVLFWDRPAAERMRSIKLIASVIEEAEKWEMPVLVEPLTSKPIEDPEERANVLTDANRVAFELGADILKVAHPGDTKTLESWVKYFNVPIILLGGSKSGSTEDLVKMVDEAVDVGVNGVAIGRNVWQRPPEEAKELLERFANIIHKP